MSQAQWNGTPNIPLLNEEQMDANINARFEYLYEKPLLQYFRRDGTDIILGAAATDIATLGGVNYDFTNANIAFWLQGTVSGNNAGGDVYFDIRVQAPVTHTLQFYVSSGTLTPLARGIASYRPIVVNHEYQISMYTIAPISFPPFSDDVEFVLEAYCTVGVGTIHLAGTTFQWVVEHYGKSRYPDTGEVDAAYSVDWAGSKTWRAGENITEGALNLHIENKMKWLYGKNVNFVRKSGTSYSTTSTTFVPVGAEDIKTYLVTEGNDIMVRLCLTPFPNGLASRLCYFDILVDDSYYISSLTATPLTDGLANYQSNVGFPHTISIEALLTEMDAGLHTFVLYYKTSAADTPASVAANTPTLLMVEEYCLT